MENVIFLISFSCSFIFIHYFSFIIIAMVKYTQKKATTRKEKVPLKAISKGEYREFIRSKVCKKVGKSKVKAVLYD